MNQSHIGTLLFLLLFSFGATAQHQDLNDLEEAKTLFKQAEIAYRVGDYEEALQGYKAAYLRSRASALLYNMAQCQRHLGRHEEALRSYRLYLQDAPDSPYRAEVEQIIIELEALLGRPTEAKSLPTSSPALRLEPPDNIAVLPPATTPRSPYLLPGAAVGVGALLEGTFWLLRRRAFQDQDFTGKEQQRLIAVGVVADVATLASVSWLLISYKTKKAPERGLSIEKRPANGAALSINNAAQQRGVLLNSGQEARP